MKDENLILGIATLAAVAAIAIFSASYFFPESFTGRVTDTATINLTVESSLAINFTTDNINWGSGRVNGGSANATLDTSAGASNVTNGNWTGNTAGLVLQNIGSVIVNVSIKTGKTAASLLGGGNPIYQYNVTNSEASSCVRNTTTFGVYFDVNTTDPGTKVCDIFNFTDSADTIRIDIKLIIPSDSSTGALSDTITATAL